MVKTPVVPAFRGHDLPQDCEYLFDAASNMWRSMEHMLVVDALLRAYDKQRETALAAPKMLPGRNVEMQALCGPGVVIFQAHERCKTQRGARRWMLIQACCRLHGSDHLSMVPELGRILKTSFQVTALRSERSTFQPSPICFKFMMTSSTASSMLCFSFGVIFLST